MGFSTIAEIRDYRKRIKAKSSSVMRANAKKFRRTKTNCPPLPSLKSIVSTTVIFLVSLQHLTSKGSVATGQHAYDGWFEMSITSSQLPIAYDSYLPFLQENPQRHNQDPMATNQRESKKRTPASRTYPLCSITYNGQIASMPRSPGPSNQGFEALNQITSTERTLISRKPLTNQSRHQVSQGCGVGLMEIAVGEARLSQQPATKKDSRGWQEHEKTLVKTLMLEVMSENAHARTEKRWKIISKSLNSRYSIGRTWTAVKK